MKVVLYHATPATNLPSIRREGLVAQCGEGCVGLNKNRVGVYFWRHEAAAKSFAAGWGKCVVLTVEVPEEQLFLLRKDDEYFEDETEAYVYPTDVPPYWIKAISKTFHRAEARRLAQAVWGIL